MKTQRHIYTTRHIEEKIYNFIIDYKKANDGLSPSRREIVSSLKLCSTSYVTYYLRKLEKSGLIKITDESARGITVTGGKWMPPET